MGWERASSHIGGVAAKCERENARVLQPACLLLRGRRRPARTKKPRNQRARQAAAAIAVPDPGGPPPHHAAVAKRGREGGVRREYRRGGGREELNRARVPGIISRVSLPFKTATALGQREGFVVQDRVGECFRVAACFSLSLLGYEWFGARKRNAPHRCACALRSWTKRCLAPPGHRKTLRGSA